VHRHAYSPTDRLPRARLRDDTSLPSERAELRAAVVAAIENGFAASLKVDALGADYEAWFDGVVVRRCPARRGRRRRH